MKTTKVLTWESPSNRTINVCQSCEEALRAKHEWPKDNRGEEYCRIGFGGLHDGICTLCAAKYEPCSLCGQPSSIPVGGTRAQWYLCNECAGIDEADRAGYSHGNAGCVGPAATEMSPTAEQQVTSMIEAALAAHRTWDAEKATASGGAWPFWAERWLAGERDVDDAVSAAVHARTDAERDAADAAIEYLTAQS